MKALSLHQPYAEFIKSGAKRYETRHWSTPYRGLIAIHAAQRWTDDEKATASALHRQFPAIPLIDNPPLGAVVCICRLLDCVRTESIAHSISRHEKAVGGWSEGRFAWELEVLEIFDSPILAKGQQGLFDWDIPSELLEKRIAIVGSRDYEDLDAVRRYVYSLPKDITIISGGARGVDSTAEVAAKERGMRTVIIPVNQRGLPDDFHRNEAFARRAMMRNGEIVAMAGSVTAFWDEKSKGTKDTLEKAKKAGKTLLLNPNVQAKEEAPKQLVLAGFVSTYDEGAYIEVTRAEAHSKKTVDFKPYEWTWPWLATRNDVWYREKEGVYKLIPKESEQAQAWARTLGGWAYHSATHALREWLMAQKDNFIAVPCDYLELNRYAIDHALHAVKDSEIEVKAIPVEALTFTQPSYNPGICLKYLETGIIREFESGQLPMIYQFKGDERYFVSNGTHRGLAWLLGLDPMRRAALPARLARIPQTLLSVQEQVIEVDDENESLEFYADVLIQALEIMREGKLLDAWRNHSGRNKIIRHHFSDGHSASAETNQRDTLSFARLPREGPAHGEAGRLEAAGV